MEPIRTSELKAGMRLEQPLYDQSKKLLLAVGLTLTPAMILGLRRSKQEYVFLGNPEPEQETQPAPIVPVGSLREEAAKHSERLQSKIESELKSVKLDIKPFGNALERDVDDALQTERPSTRYTEWEEVANEGTRLVQQILNGGMVPDRVSESARKLLEKATKAFAVDRSLLTNLTNIKGKDEYLYRHSMNTVILSINIAAALQFDAQQVTSIGIAALLQDIGMAMVPEDILNARRKLTASEFVDIQKHSVHGLYAIEKIKGLPYDTRFIVYQCHERADGTGYPQRRQKSLIHKFAQIVAVADAYDALTSDRPWRKAYQPYRAMEELIMEANKGKFDGDIVRGLLSYLSLFPVGSLVKLNSGDIARVVHSNREAIDRPVVALLFDAQGKPCSGTETVDLLRSNLLKVESVYDGNPGVQLTDGF